MQAGVLCSGLGGPKGGDGVIRIPESESGNPGGRAGLGDSVAGTVSWKLEFCRSSTNSEGG